jgi:hypothetical protein
MRYEAIFEANQYYGSPSARRREEMAAELQRALSGDSVEVREEVVADGLVRCIVVVGYGVRDDGSQTSDGEHHHLVDWVTEAMGSIGLYAVRVVVHALPPAVAGGAAGAAAGVLAGAAAGMALMSDRTAAAALVGGVLGGLLGTLGAPGVVWLVGSRQDGRWQFWCPAPAQAVAASASG